MSKDRPKLLDVNTVANRLTVSIQTVYRLIKKGELPAHRYGGGYRLEEPIVEEYRERNYRPT
jgi:excisionase family DNA binding protein